MTPRVPNKYRGKTPQPPEDPNLPEASLFAKADLERELRWVQDPLKLAARTLELLRHDSYFKALALVRLASSKGLPCTVSWNHLVDYDMRKDRVAAAIKTYNEVRLGNPSVQSGS